MDRTCPEWDRLEAASASRGVLGSVPPGRAQHLEGCKSCRSDWRAHRELLRHLLPLPRPEFSPHFMARFRSRAASAPAPRRLTPGARRSVAAYWAMACLASGIVLSLVPFPAQVWRHGLVAAAFLLPWIELAPERKLRRLAALSDGR